MAGEPVPLDYSEALISRQPVIVRRRVRWGECDPAGVVYTPRFSEYLVSAWSWFVRVVFDEAGCSLSDAGIGTPMRAMSLDFHRTLAPDDFFDMTVRVAGIRTRTFDLDITATTPNGELRFTGRMTPILVERATAKSTAIPAAARTSLVNYSVATNGALSPS